MMNRHALLALLAFISLPAIVAAQTVTAFDKTNNGNSTSNPLSHGGYDMVGGSTSGQIEVGQLITLNNGFTTGALSSVNIWASDSTTTAETYTLSVYGVQTSGTGIGRPSSTVLETLTGTIPEVAAGAAPFQFLKLTPTGTAALVSANTSYWFVVTEAPPAGYWGSMTGTTAQSTPGYAGTTYNELYTTVGTSGVTYTNTSGLLQESALVTVTAVPLPASLPLLLSGIASLGFMARRSKVAAA